VSPVRATLDVDVIVEDTSEDAPICRWKADDVILDAMPTDPKILGFGNQWFTSAYEASEWTDLPSGKQIRLLQAPYFLVTKFEAFACRGENDYLMSRDMEDIVTVIDGRPEIVAEI